MEMPEAASKGNLEDILASIRQSLADETVDGLVKLSAAAAAAARAEAKQGGKAKAQIAHSKVGANTNGDADDAQSALTGKLAGALKADDGPADDLSELLAEHVAPDAPDAEAATAPGGGDNSLSKMWFLRPGAPEETQASPGNASAPTLSLDPFAETGKTSSTLASRMKALAAGSRADTDDDATDEPETMSQQAADGSDAKPNAPRLDREKIDLINKLKASSAAAVESIGFPADVVDLRGSEPATKAAGTDDASEFEISDATAKALLARPERSTPLFGAEPDLRRPIVSAPLQASMLLPQTAPDEVVVEPKDAAASEAPAVPEIEAAEIVDLSPEQDLVEDDVGEAELAAVEPEAVLEEAPAGASDETPGDTHAAAEADPAVALLAHFQTAKTVASVAPGAGSGRGAPQSSVAGLGIGGPGGMPATKPLEDMIAALLQPVLQRVLDKNLAPMLETLVRREVEKALKERLGT